MVREIDESGARYASVNPDLLDLDEVEFELIIRRINHARTSAERRRALWEILRSESDPERSVVRAVIVSMNPDQEFSYCCDRFDQIEQEYRDNEHVRRRSLSRLSLLSLRARRNARMEIGGIGRFEPLLQRIESLSNKCVIRETPPKEVERMLERLTVNEGLRSGRASERTPPGARALSEGRQASPSRRVEFRESTLGSRIRVNRNPEINDNIVTPSGETPRGRTTTSGNPIEGSSGPVGNCFPERYLGQRPILATESGSNQPGGGGEHPYVRTGAVPNRRRQEEACRNGNKRGSVNQRGSGNSQPPDAMSSIHFAQPQIMIDDVRGQTSQPNDDVWSTDHCHHFSQELAPKYVSCRVIDHVGRNAYLVRDENRDATHRVHANDLIKDYQ